MINFSHIFNFSKVFLIKKKFSLLTQINVSQVTKHFVTILTASEN